MLLYTQTTDTALLFVQRNLQHYKDKSGNASWDGDISEFE